MNSVALIGRLTADPSTHAGEKRSRLQVVADAVRFLGAPKGAKPAADDDEKPADRPALGAYRRKAS